MESVEQIDILLVEDNPLDAELHSFARELAAEDLA